MCVSVCIRGESAKQYDLEEFFSVKRGWGYGFGRMQQNVRDTTSRITTTRKREHRSGRSGTDLKVDRVDRAGVRRGVFFRVAAAIDIVVNVRQRAARSELIPQVNVQMLAARLRWTGAGTLDGQRGLRYAGSRGTSTH